MTDPNLAIIDVNFAPIIINAVLLLGFGLTMLYAKQVNDMGRTHQKSRPMNLPKCRQPVPLNTFIVGIVAAMLVFSSFAESAMAKSPAKTRVAAQPRMSVMIPVIDAERGRRLFVTKGCFICHAVKGVGGKAAPALDATPGSRAIDVLGFVARMWQGAPLMFELQSMELGYRIEFKANEIADLAGFIGDSRAQEGFSRREIPEVVRDWMVNQAWWKDRSIKAGDILPEKFPDLDGVQP